MNEADVIHWAKDSSRTSLTWAPDNITCTEPYGFGDERPMSDHASGSGLRHVREFSETTSSQHPRHTLRRDLVWQAAYGLCLTHAKSVVASRQRSNHSEHVVVSSPPKTSYTN